MPRDAYRVWLRMCVCVWPIHQRTCGSCSTTKKLQVIWSFNRCCILFERKETGFRLRAVRVHDSWSAIHLGLVDDALWPEHTPLNAPHELYFYSNLFARCASFLQKLSAAAFFFFWFSWGSCFIFMKFISYRRTKHTRALLFWDFYEKVLGICLGK